MNTTADTLNDRITDRLDSIERGLPMVPSKTFGLARATVRRTNQVVCAVADRVGDSLGSVSNTASTAAKTTAGQGRAAAERTVDTARRGAAETVGQAEAQVDRTRSEVRDQATGLLDDARRTVDPKKASALASLADLSKAELYERAQERNIDGRSSMDKAQLIRALRSA